MNQTYSLSPNAVLYHADARDVLRMLPADSLDSGVMDPPYAFQSIVKRFANSPRSEATENAENPFGRTGRGFMGMRWDNGECAFDLTFWAEVLRVLKPGAHLVAFGSSRGYHRMACAIEDAGFEIRDSLMWLYGTGFPKSQNVAKFIDKELGVSGSAGEYKSETHAAAAARGERVQTGIAIHDRPWMSDPEALERQAREYLPGSPEAQEWEGWGTALKPAFEPIVLARKPLSEDTVAANVLRWRTGALNIDACRVQTEETIKATRNIALGSSSGGVYSAANTPGVYVQKDGGRWPANVCHDGSDEVVGAFPADRPGAHTQQRREGTSKTTHTYGEFKNGSTADFSRVARNDKGSAARFFFSAKASKADRAGSKHPTVKRVDLMTWLCRLVTPPGGTVLDCFAGSGTTGVAANGAGFNVILCEREAQFVADICSRYSPSIAAD